MTRERVRAHQTTADGPKLALVRATITALNPLTVALPGGNTTTGIKIPGIIYTVGASAYVLAQQPAVGPVLPVTATDTGTFAYTGTAADYGNGWATTLTRAGNTTTFQLGATTGANTFPAGTNLGTIPDGFRPKSNTAFVIPLFPGSWTGATAHVRVGTTGVVTVPYTSVTPIPASTLLPGSISYPTA